MSTELELSGRDAVLDVTTATFERQVLEESRRRPVVVDFWAAWCGPCRILGPVLERLAAEGGGRWVLAKVDVDQEPDLAAAFRIRGIPAVKAFRDGAVVDELTGALPEPELRRWLEGFVPGPADEAAAEGRRAEEAGDGARARAAYERALELRARHAAALLGLARLDGAEGRTDDAVRRLDLLLPADADRLGPEVAAQRLALRGGGSLADAEARARRNPDDLGATVALGRSLAAAGRPEEGLETLLGVIRKVGREGPGEEARAAMIEVFEAVGARSELADRYRSLLARELYR